MAWYTLKPVNTGGGRPRQTPSAKIDSRGQLTLNHEACALLGYPERVIVRVEPELCQIRLAPTTPDDTGGFSLSGGGNTPHRIRMQAAIGRWPTLVGKYAVRRTAGSVELRQETGEKGELEI